MKSEAVFLGQPDRLDKRNSPGGPSKAGAKGPPDHVYTLAFLAE